MSRTLPRPIRGRGRSLASMVVMELTFEGGCHGVARWQKDQDRASSFRQRNELVLVGNSSKAAGLPVLLGLLDPLFTGGDEVPPDMTRAFEGISTEKHHPRRFQRLDGDAVARAKNQKTRTLIALVGDFDLAVHDIDGALLMVGIKWNADACFRRDLDIEPGRD